MKKIIVLSATVLVILSLMVPVTYGSTLKISLYPEKKLANVNLESESELIFTYPNGSFASKMLNGSSENISFSETFNHPSDHAIAFIEGYLKSRYHNVTVDNMTVIFNLTENANNTELKIYKNLSLDLWLSGIFNKTKSETKVNLSWRSFEIKGSFDINGHDVNNFGSYLGSIGMFTGLMDRLNNKSTINFTMLKVPLSKWNRTYDSSTNTTTFYYNSSLNELLSISVNGTGMFNGTYTLKLLYDPSSTISVPGYATASNNTITILPSAPNTFDMLIIIVAVVAVVVIIAGIALAIRKR
ncbi:MAG: hypothetical protein ACP5F1_05425 [Thermoplasmata archaeon]|nr:hypothetical protein [Thermoplasmata archaeon]